MKRPCRVTKILALPFLVLALAACDDDTSSTAPVEDDLAPEGVSSATEVRTLVKRFGSSGEPCLIDLEFGSLQPIADDDPEWSPWMDVGEGSGTLEVPSVDAGSSYLLAIQVRDADGDVDDALEWQRNVVHVRVAP